MAEQRAMGPPPAQQPSAAGRQATQADRASGPPPEEAHPRLAGRRWLRILILARRPVAPRRLLQLSRRQAYLRAGPGGGFFIVDGATSAGPPSRRRRQPVGGATASAAGTGSTGPTDGHRRTPAQAAWDEFRFPLHEPGTLRGWAANSWEDPRSADGVPGGRPPHLAGERQGSPATPPGQPQPRLGGLVLRGLPGTEEVGPPRQLSAPRPVPATGMLPAGGRASARKSCMSATPAGRSAPACGSRTSSPTTSSPGLDLLRPPSPLRALAPLALLRA